MDKERVVYVAYTNSDCTEGRGYDIPIFVCEKEATAKRLARKQYVQGGDGPVREVPLLMHEGKWFAPLSVISLIPPTKDDDRAQKGADERRVAMEKAKLLGLTDADIAAIGFK